jgi:iron complex outermembrane receptor protein
MFYGRNSAKPFFFFYDSPKTMGITTLLSLNINYKRLMSNDDITMYSRSLNYFCKPIINFRISLPRKLFSHHQTASQMATGPYFYLVTDETAVDLIASPGVTLPNLPGNNNYIYRNDQATANSKFGTIPRSRRTLTAILISGRCVTVLCLV